MSTTSNAIKFVVLGEPASKANTRQIVTNPRTNKTMVIKSQKARNYADQFALQCPQINPPITRDVRVIITIYYATRRPDLDESVILDCMQSETVSRPIPGRKKREQVVVRNNIYRNDRQVREKHIYWRLDRDNPRAEIEIEILDE